jgi:DNA-binding response OmpR family regulator
MRILLAEDEKGLSAIIKRGLSEEGYATDPAYDGEEARFMADTSVYDLIILDIMLPKKNGLDVCRELRATGRSTPILMLTAKDSIEDRVAGLDSGADDYLIKPFNFRELLARVRALLRRESPVKSSKITLGDLTLDTATREVRRGGAPIELTAKEYAILEYFMRHPRQVVTRTMLEQKVWDFSFDGISNVIDVYIKRLRSKLDRKDGESLFETVRGAGYRLDRGEIL